MLNQQMLLTGAAFLDLHGHKRAEGAARDLVFALRGLSDGAGLAGETDPEQGSFADAMAPKVTSGNTIICQPAHQMKLLTGEAEHRRSCKRAAVAGPF